jgi:hypothetical protein
MVHHLKLFLLFLLTFKAYGQDERYFRQILKGETPNLSLQSSEFTTRELNVDGASYHVDLNGDGIEEILRPQKRDGVDSIEIRDSSSRIVFEAKLLAIGGDSAIYKIKLAQLSKEVKVLILFLDEGQSTGKKFENLGRIFLLTLENNDLSQMKMTMGPHHFHEKEGQREQYWRRDYSVELRDLDHDGVRDVIVEYNHIQRIMRYKGKGEWERL